MASRTDLGAILELFGDHVGAILGPFLVILGQLEAIRNHVGAPGTSLTHFGVLPSCFEAILVLKREEAEGRRLKYCTVAQFLGDLED